MQHFVPMNIGFDAISKRDFIANHFSEFANKLYNPEPAVPVAIVIANGGYGFLPNSRDFRTLRQSFSMHKHRSFIKTHMIVGVDGYIVDIQGPYFSDSKNNDAAILKNKFANNTKMK